MRTRIRLASIFCLLFLCATAPAGNPGAPTSPRAVEAKEKFDQLIQTAQKAGDDAAAVAKKNYILDLQRLMNSAMASANMVEANWAKAELARANAGDFAPADVPKLSAPVEIRARYDRAVDKAYVDRRPQVESARRQYTAELESCKKVALAQSRDLDEANRISSEIQRAATLDITSPEWVNLLAPSHLTEWVQEKEFVTKRINFQPDGSIILNGFGAYGRSFADGRLHARVRKISGLNVALFLRVSDAGSYAAFCNGGTGFGIGMNKDGRWIDLVGGNSKPYKGMVEMEFSAIGQDLVLKVAGEELIRAKDATFDRGRAGIIAYSGQSQMADVRLRILDPTSAPPAD